jgi:hypothetical protein
MTAKFHLIFVNTLTHIMKTKTISNPAHADRGACSFIRQPAASTVLLFLPVLALLLSATPICQGADNPKAFTTPQEAVAALISAVTAKDTNALHALFGAAADDLQNPDRVQATNELNAFGAAITLTNRLARKSDTKYELEVGDSFWPFPVPIIKRSGAWMFDADAGQEELLNRRIGKNELATLQVARAYVDAQREYASRDRDGDEVLEYAQKLSSTPGTHDGLYWPIGPDGETSPLGPLVAFAQGEGYTLTRASDDETPAPYHGYYFRILDRQGKHAPGGKYNYVINGHMIAGFALVAWPAEYGQSGIMTFMVNQQGKVYQKDVGPDTAKIVKKMKAYDPDPSWRVSTE